jgi:hypothetical protein
MTSREDVTVDPRRPVIDFEPLTREELNEFLNPPSSRTLAFARYAYLAILLVGMVGLVFMLREAGGA